MVSESSLEVVFSQSDVRFSSVIVVAFNGCSARKGTPLIAVIAVTYVANRFRFIIIIIIIIIIIRALFK